MKKNILPLLLVAVASLHSASAVTFNIALDAVTTSTNSYVPTNSLALLVVQNGSSSFTNLNAGASAVLNTYISGSSGNGNYIAWKGDFSGSGANGFFYDSAYFTIDGVNVTNNAVFALYWFPTLTLSTTSIAAGTSYGYYTSTDATQFGSDTNWNVGANNAALYDINAITYDNTGINTNTPLSGGLPDSALKATYAVAPEPSTYCLLGVGALALLVIQYRRRSEGRSV